MDLASAEPAWTAVEGEPENAFRDAVQLVGGEARFDYAIPEAQAAAPASTPPATPTVAASPATSETNWVGACPIDADIPTFSEVPDDVDGTFLTVQRGVDWRSLLSIHCDAHPDGIIVSQNANMVSSIGVPGFIVFEGDTSTIIDLNSGTHIFPSWGRMSDAVLRRWGVDPLTWVVGTLNDDTELRIINLLTLESFPMPGSAPDADLIWTAYGSADATTVALIPSPEITMWTGTEIGVSEPLDDFGNVLILDVTNGESHWVEAPVGHYQISLSPDSTRLFTAAGPTGPGSEGSASIIDVASGVPLVSIERGDSGRLSPTPWTADGSLILVEGSSIVRYSPGREDAPETVATMDADFIGLFHTENRNILLAVASALDNPEGASYWLINLITGETTDLGLTLISRMPPRADSTSAVVPALQRADSSDDGDALVILNATTGEVIGSEPLTEEDGAPFNPTQIEAMGGWASSADGSVMLVTFGPAYTWLVELDGDAATFTKLPHPQPQTTASDYYMMVPYVSSDGEWIALSPIGGWSSDLVNNEPQNWPDNSAWYLTEDLEWEAWPHDPDDPNTPRIEFVPSVPD